MSRKPAAASRIMDPDKAARVEQERARLMELFTGADPNKLDFIREHVQQLAWLGITIQELQEDIDERGPVVPYQNGKEQTGLQANPACKTLKDFQTLYNTQFRALLPVLPERRSEEDPFAEYRDEPMSEEEKEAAYQEQMKKLKLIKQEIKIYDE